MKCLVQCIVIVNTFKHAVSASNQNVFFVLVMLPFQTTALYMMSLVSPYFQVKCIFIVCCPTE